MKSYKMFLPILLCGIIWGCDKKNDDVITPLSAENFPQVILFDDEGDGGLEDEDEFSFKLTLIDRVDPEGEELGGKLVPLNADVTVSFEIDGYEGFSTISDYIKAAYAFYEVDDCTTSEDLNIDLNLSFDLNTGKGSVRFPANVEEVEVVFEVDEDFFNDNDVNEEERNITFKLTGVQAASGLIAFNADREFTYEILDDEGVHGDWELDHEDPIAFAAFKALFGQINEELQDLTADEIDKIEISIEYSEVKVVIELKETEMVEECGDIEEENKVIEIEADLEELDLLTNEGEIEFVGEVEQDNGTVKEFVYAGSFSIINQILTLVLTGEFDGEETAEITLELNK